MSHRLHILWLGGAAALALSAGALSAGAAAAAEPAAPPPGPSAERHIVIARSGPGGVEVYDSDQGPGGAFGPHHGMDRHDPERAAKHLRDVLQLTPAQEPALKAYLAAMAPPERPERDEGRRLIVRGPDGKPDLAKLHDEMAKLRGDREAKRAEEAALTTPERLDRMVKREAEHSARRQAELTRHVAAVKQFYAALTPTQQKAFDALHGGMGPGLGGHPGEDMPGMRIHMMRMGALGPRPPEPPLPPPPPPAPGI